MMLNPKNNMYSVIDSVLRYLRENIPKGEMYLVGSLATGEMTNICINNYTEVSVSDFDVIIFVDVSTYIRSFILNVANKLSRAATSELRSKGLKTHVSIGIVSPRIFKFLPFLAPNTIYLHEMRRVLWSNKGYYLSPYEFHVTPDKLDCINLVFSALADYLFMRLELFGNLTVYEKCYIVAKRYVTLIYSLLLFKEKDPRGYLSTSKQARDYFRDLQNIISPNELEMLDVLAKYKTSGDEKILYRELPLKLKDINEVLVFLYDNFEKLAVKVLLYELSGYFCIHANEFSIERGNMLPKLLHMYQLKSKLPLTKCFAFIMLHVGSYLKNRDYQKLMFALYTLTEKRLKLEAFLRYLIGELFCLFIRMRISVDEDKARLKRFVSNVKILWDLFMV